MSHAGTVLTFGGSADEATAWATFDEIVARSFVMEDTPDGPVRRTAFRSYREVAGEFVHPRPLTGQGAVRIDRILIPTSHLILAGWDGGAFGIEGKKSGTKLGPLISQAIDYSRCVFEIKHAETGRISVLLMLKWIFIYDSLDPGAELGSIMAQNRIGYANAGEFGALAFGCGGTIGIRINREGLVTAKPLPMGNKRGSR